MSSNARYDFFPVASIVAFVFIGVSIIIGLIGRCLALNQSTVRSAQSLDLVIYRVPQKPNQIQGKVRPSMDINQDLADNWEQKLTTDEPVHVRRGPKNL